MANIVLGVDGMSCQKCVTGLTGVLLALPGVERVEVSLEGGQATLIYDPDKISLIQFKDAIEGAGFDLR